MTSSAHVARKWAMAWSSSLAGAAAALLARACSVAGARSSSSSLRHTGRLIDPRRWQTAAAAVAQSLEPTTNGTPAAQPVELLSNLEGFVQRARRRLLARQGTGGATTVVGVAGSLAAPAVEPWTAMDEAWLAALKRHLAAPNENPTDRTRTAVVTRLLGYSDAYQYAVLLAMLSVLNVSGSRAFLGNVVHCRPGQSVGGPGRVRAAGQPACAQLAGPV